MDVILVAITLQVLGGSAALVCSKWPHAATVAGAGGTVLGCLLALPTTLRVLHSGTPESVNIAWDAAHGAFSCELDPLSAFFLLPILVLSALAAVYGSSYMLAYRHKKSLGSPWLFFNVLVAAMVLVVVARTAILFLMAWEMMTVAAFCVVTFEHEKAEVRRAGWIYLVAAHFGVLLLFLAFMLLIRNAGSLDFAAFATMPALDARWSGIIFILALVGFGTKVGFVPIHVWLPEAHPAAPSHVSALMSGVLIKTGIYGILRILTFLGQPTIWWGPTLAGLGLVTGLVGIALALQQRDVKRVLAYSSIENVGLIALALGLWLWGRANGLPAVAVLGITAALLHIWSHAVMKGLMFLAAGSVLHGTGTKDMEKLGGLMQKMPWTGSAMMVGAVAIASLPPLNGFVSKWLMYLSLIKCGFEGNDSYSLTALFAVGLLALIGGLAAVAFVRLTGMVLLGSPRSEAARHAHESSPLLLGPMLVLVALCLTIAVIPQAVVGFMSSAIHQVLGMEIPTAVLNLQSSEAPLVVLGELNAWTLIACAALAVFFLAWSRNAARVDGSTWGCGYVRPTARMQYTGLSFSEMIAEHLLPRLLRPQSTKRGPQGLFPSQSDFESECPDPITEKMYEPFFDTLGEGFSRLRILQQGKVHVYLVYIVLMVVLTLGWVTFRTWWLES